LKKKVNRCLELINQIEDILTSEIQAILDVDINIQDDLLIFLNKNRIQSWSLKSALDYLDRYNEIGIISEVHTQKYFLPL
jgi:hypothetical protein